MVIGVTKEKAPSAATPAPVAEMSKTLSETTKPAGSRGTCSGDTRLCDNVATLHRPELCGSVGRDRQAGHLRVGPYGPDSKEYGYSDEGGDE